MEAKFSPQVKNIIAYSREEALRFGNDFIDIEHILLALIHVGEGLAIKILKALNVDLTGLTETIEKSIQIGSSDVEKLENIPLTKQAEKVMKVSYLEAKLFKAEIIDAEHLLLSILQDDNKNNIAVQTLNQFGINYDILRKKIESNNEGNIRVEAPEGRVSLSLLSAMDNPLTLFFDTEEFSKEEIAQIISFLSEVYSSIGGDELEIIGTNNLELKRVLELA